MDIFEYILVFLLVFLGFFFLTLKAWKKAFRHIMCSFYTWQKVPAHSVPSISKASLKEKKEPQMHLQCLSEGHPSER